MKYFAYGSNLSRQQMAQRAPGAVFLGRASLRDAAFLINQHGYATVIPCPSDYVEGILWELTAEDETNLDVYEGVADGLYRKHCRTVQMESGEPVLALIYIATDATPGRALAGYLAPIIRSATALGLSQQHLNRLEALWRYSPPDKP